MLGSVHKLQFLPILGVLRHYTWKQARADIQAGLNVSLLDFPQAMAYALLAGFPINFGIYASVVGSILGPIFASSRYVILGPTNSTAILVLSAFLTLDLTIAQRFIALPILVFMVGLFMVGGAFLKLAGFIKYVSRTVIIGYISAAALLIIANQLHIILGVKNIQEATFFEIIRQNILQWQDVQWPSLLIAGITALTYFVLHRYFKKIPTVAATLLIVAGSAYFLGYAGIVVEMLKTSPIRSWSLALPEFHLDFISQLGGSAMAIAFLAILESSSISKTLAARSGRQLDLNQHLLSMGAANLGSALGSGLPVSGSLSRSMLNYSSGAKTPLSSVFSGICLIIGVVLLGPILNFIPKAALATIVIFVGLSLINFESIRIVVKSTRADAVVFFVTFCAGLLFPLNMAIYLGAAASIILFLQKVSEPKLVQYTFNSRGELAASPHAVKTVEEIPEISIVHIEGELFFGSTDIFLDQTRLICDSPNLKVIILRMRNALTLDVTSAMAIADLVRFTQEKQRHFIVSGANEEVQFIFRQTGVMSLLGENNFFMHAPENPNLSTRRALKRAQDLIGEDNAKILLFTAPHEKEEKNTEK